MEKKLLISLVGLLIFITGCCNTFDGYDRYTLRVNCDEVLIDGATYKITFHDAELEVDGHTLARGIYRKTRPWLYVHNIDGNEVDITFDTGSKAEYPLYTGLSAAIFDVYAHDWEMTKSTTAAFADDYWLVSHRWSDSGIFFDLQQRLGDNTQWQLVQPDIFIPNDGTNMPVSQIRTTISISSFDAVANKAQVAFTAF